MCGIVGIFGSVPEGTETQLNRMIDVIEHRGPDDRGVWYDADSGIGLGHARLSIVDLSAAGKQPMPSASGRYIISYNGEIYNHEAIRNELSYSCGELSWRGHSDTETLLAAIDYWGLEGALKKIVGMFAFALWDKQNRQLYLARDRVGEKPLYYGWFGDKFVFASELHALKALSFAKWELDRDALTTYFRHKYIAAPYTIYKNVYKLKPGTYAEIKQNCHQPEIRSYWSPIDICIENARKPYQGSAEDATHALEQKLARSVSQQLMGDVPIGAFLSGGIDSSIIVALMQASTNKPVNTFSIGFDIERYNEAEYAKQVAKHLGTNHTEVYVTPDDAMDVIPKLPTMYDEPFADVSQIPTYLVSALARENVAVALSGDAGDELFCGYNRYLFTNNLWSKIGGLPLPIRSMLARLLTTIPPAFLNSGGGMVSMIPFCHGLSMLGDKVHKGAGVLSSASVDELYFSLLSQWKNPEKLIVGASEPSSLLSEPAWDHQELGDIQGMMLKDFLHYLPDDILTKVDRAAMNVSLETRIPFLDHRIIEFAWSIPQDMKIRDGQSKWLLRQVLYKHVPRSLIDRPKMGFGVPIEEWLRGPLKSWMLDLLDESLLRRQGILDPIVVQKRIEEHLSGRRNWSEHLWNVLMFQGWLAEELQ